MSIKNRTSFLQSFKGKMSLLVIISLSGISVLVIIFAGVLNGTAILNNAKSVAGQQQQATVLTMEKELDSVYQLGMLVVNNSVVLEDLTANPEEVSNYAVLQNDVYIELLNAVKLNDHVSEMTVLKYSDDTLKYVNASWRAPEEKRRIFDTAKEDFSASSESAYAEMKILSGKSYFSDKEGVHLYFPIHHPLKLYMEVGLLCITIEEETLEQFYVNSLFENTFMINEAGVIISSPQKEKIGENYEPGELLKETDGSRSDKGEYMLWHYIPISGWYIISAASIYSLVSDAVWPLIVMLCIVLVICMGIAVICYRVMQKNLNPLHDLRSRMNKVAGGDMSIRMDVEYKEEEFKDMTYSFNTMIKNVDALMYQIQEEQRQKMEIELSALQSQIKPHFLYNSLECIHWQALLEEAPQTSELIMALSNYYRLCLEKGQDIVSLSQELTHIESYLVIQNARYSNIITLETTIAENVLTMPIPKMTLQPLVENSIYHGIKVKRGEYGKILISAYRQEDRVIICVEDDGIGMTEEKTAEINRTISVFDEEYGYGVRNVNRRLEILFGTEYGLRYECRKPCGVSVYVTLPGTGRKGGEKNV